MKILEKIHWKFLLGVFKLKRIVAGVFSKKLLDFPDKKIFIKTKTLREYKTRAHSCEKEPETCDWLNRVSGEKEVLYDIGANIGAYSLISASLGSKVYAFEPSPENYATLHENIRINSLNDLVIAMPFVLGSLNKEESFSVSDNTSGATATFIAGNSEKTIKEHLPMVRLDFLIENFGIQKPTIMKIDVDGAEVEVLKGATKTLGNKNLRSVLVEVEADLKNEVNKIMESNNFKKEGEYERHKGVQNLIYKRV